MQTRQLFLATLMCGTLATAMADSPPAMKMTTDIPDGIATPDRLETSIGTLTSFDGVPDKATTRKIYDQLDLQRATQAFLSTIQVASLVAMEHGLRSFGPPNTTVLQFENLMDSKSLWLTPNTVSVYQAAWMELGDEPMVLETPPNVLGFIDDAWFQYVVDFGNAGPDKGQGGKFLILPPGYEGNIPDGYHVARSQTYGNWVAGFPGRWFDEAGDRSDANEVSHVSPVAERQSPDDEFRQCVRQRAQHDSSHGLRVLGRTRRGDPGRAGQWTQPRGPWPVGVYWHREGQTLRAGFQDEGDPD
jgi:hypothetical protein